MTKKKEKNQIGFDGIRKRIDDLGKDTNEKRKLKIDQNIELTREIEFKTVKEYDNRKTTIWAIISALSFIVFLAIIPDQMIPKIKGIPFLLIEKEIWPILVVFIVLLFFQFVAFFYNSM